MYLSTAFSLVIYNSLVVFVGLIFFMQQCMQSSLFGMAFTINPTTITTTPLPHKNQRRQTNDSNYLNFLVTSTTTSSTSLSCYQSCMIAKNQWKKGDCHYYIFSRQQQRHRYDHCHSSSLYAIRNTWTRRSHNVIIRKKSRLLLSPEESNQADDDEQPQIHPSGNPYADPNYPDLEFVNYDDPAYQVDQGIADNDVMWTKQQPSREIMNDQDEYIVEKMREERRKRNDEYQFQTYYKEILKNGQKFYGEWTVYKTSTFLSSSIKSPIPSSRQPPKLIQISKEPTLRVVSYGYKENMVQENSFSSASTYSDSERIRHNETLFHDKLDSSTNDEDMIVQEKYIDTDSGLGKSAATTTNSPESTTIKKTTTTTTKLSTDYISIQEEMIQNKYWPNTLEPIHFRGHQGIMVCGNAYTTCAAVSLDTDNINHGHNIYDPSTYLGPFSEYRTELGILENNVRLRLKFDYSVLQKINEQEQPTPPLHLRSMTVCREAIGMFPSTSMTTSGGTNTNPFDEATIKEAFFGKAGADGGLYDPPPIRVEEQASQYMLLDLDGKASVLFPYIIDQDPVAHNGEGWVHTLDWTPGNMRYQVDRKVNSGVNLLGLRTLELSEVQSIDAETYRPRDGGQNMRQ